MSLSAAMDPQSNHEFSQIPYPFHSPKPQPGAAPILWPLTRCTVFLNCVLSFHLKSRRPKPKCFKTLPRVVGVLSPFDVRHPMLHVLSFGATTPFEDQECHSTARSFDLRVLRCFGYKEKGRRAKKHAENTLKTRPPWSFQRGCRDLSAFIS
jgi:hypothetical protein